MSKALRSEKGQIANNTSYLICGSCNLVNQSEFWIVGDNKELCCPNCLAPGGSSSWPDLKVQQLFTSINNLHGELLEYNQIASILYVAAVRIMIEDLVRTIAFGDLMYEEAGHLVDTLLALNPKHEQLLKVLEELSSECYEDLVDDTSEENFYPTFLRIMNIRNQLLYGEYCDVSELPHEFIEQIIPKTLEIFSRLNNEHNPRLVMAQITAGLMADKGLQNLPPL
ncbi:MAG: hypothetical protein HOL70_11550 [Candidatus Marinimicrobia bacterium]|nr:hypothetical protein [Candidatus Neomarinimicrobiota bacterium]